MGSATLPVDPVTGLVPVVCLKKFPFTNNVIGDIAGLPPAVAQDAIAQGAAELFSGGSSSSDRTSDGSDSVRRKGVSRPGADS